MSQESWLTITGIVVTVALALTGIVVGVVGWLISRMFAATDREIQDLQDDNTRFRVQITRLETVLADRGLLPRKLKYPSPPETSEETA